MARMVRILLPVSDLDEAAVFYSQVLLVPAKKLTGTRIRLKCAGIELVCYDPIMEGNRVGKGWILHENQYLYFAVANLEATYMRAKNNGCSEIDAVISRNERGESIFRCKDPFGNPLCFIDEKTMADDVM